MNETSFPITVVCLSLVGKFSVHKRVLMKTPVTKPTSSMMPLKLYKLRLIGDDTTLDELLYDLDSTSNSADDIYSNFVKIMHMLRSENLQIYPFDLQI